MPEYISSLPSRENNPLQKVIIKERINLLNRILVSITKQYYIVFAVLFPMKITIKDDKSSDFHFQLQKYFYNSKKW